MLIDVLKQFEAGQIPTLPNDAGQPPVFQIDRMEDPALAAKLETERRPVHPYVAIAHGGKTERLVVFGILLIADADQRHFQQAHHGRENFFARQTGKPRDPTLSVSG